MILWFVIIGVLFYLLISGDFELRAFKKNSVEEHLSERLVNGDISIEEYKEMKRAIKENGK